VAVLAATGVRKVFGSGELSVVAVEDANIEVRAGELVALLGPSGSGKTTLLLCISLILEPTAGTIAVNGKTIYADGRARLDVRRFRRENIGFVFQGNNLIPFLSVVDNVALALQLNGVDRHRARRRAHELLEYFEIDQRANLLPGEISGGEQQRVAIARALANEPPLVLADEPTASLDTERGEKVMALLRRVAREKNSAVITVTHDVRMVAGFDTVYRIADGRVSPAETAVVASGGGAAR
jgi:putative ABC transport system ATP-binding protein